MFVESNLGIFLIPQAVQRSFSIQEVSVLLKNKDKTEKLLVSKGKKQ